MGNVVVQQFVSVDGFAANDRGEFDILEGLDGDSSDFDRSNLGWIEQAGAIVLAARTYEMFVAYWPTPVAVHEVVAPSINALPKHVFSRTLTSAPWGSFNEAAIESGELTDVIPKIQASTDGDLIIWGSLTLTDDLFRAGLVDVVRLVVAPVAIGTGRAVFPADVGTLPLRLRNTTRFSAGLVELEYAVGQRTAPR
ncbi:dihydrofolate reductase [Glaciihabitans tibetensis]|uniref:Dihydrofolate reductase n=1 Tax=Glaciihabitans tibetensis TaxID=1266600 RepID=A0A2T0VFT7_9MICO|nr:dihydrofolate reductase [Glaciihabitans tibetensis]